MKQLMGLTIVIALSMPGIALSAGAHSNGFVDIAPNQYLYGTMNVRYNSTAPGNPYIAVAGNRSNVEFYGLDSDNEYFSCYVQSGSSIFQDAVDVKNNLSNGSYLFVMKAENSSECTLIVSGNGSYLIE